MSRCRRITMLLIAFVLASGALFEAFALFLFPTGEIHYRLLDWLLPFVFLGLALLLDSWIAWTWHRAGHGLAKSLFGVLVVTLGGAILASVAAMRGDWLEIMRELFRRF